MTSPWTDEVNAKFKKLYAEGRSYGQIAAALDGISRNAIVGKVHRLGLEKRTKTISVAPKRRSRKAAASDRGAVMRRRNAAAPPLAIVSALPPLPPEAGPIGQHCSILDLTPATCRWIIGDPRTPWEPIYCGASGADNAAVPAEPYCKCHRDMA
jgi:GcrA cell cycle regulator